MEAFRPADLAVRTPRAGRTRVRYVLPMERIEVDGHVLTWDVSIGQAELTVQSWDRYAGTSGPTTVFHLAVRDDRLKISLALLPTSRTIDVSLQPGVLGQVLPVGTGPSAPGTAGATVAGWVTSLVGTSYSWRPSDPAGLGPVATVGGAVLPLLGNAYDRGASTLTEIPRWAAPVLSGATPLDAVRTGFGRAGTRAVARALVGGLVAAAAGPPAGATRLGRDRAGRVALFRVAAALMGEGTLEPDRLARVLSTDGPAHPQEQWPDSERIAVGRAVAKRLGPVGAERLLIDAVSSVDGPTVLADVCRLFSSVSDRLPNRPAHRLEELRDECRALLPIDPDPVAGGWSRHRLSPSTIRRQPVAGAPTPQSRVAIAGGGPVAARPIAAARTHARVAPAAPTIGIAPNEPLVYPPSLAAVHGDDTGSGLRLVLPRTTSELVAWGRRLHSCVGSFGSAVAAGLSVLVGVERDGTLRYCIEVAPDRTVRQFLGERNAAVPRWVATTVCARLAALGLLRPGVDANRIWLEA
jgi:hypothetical protein